LISLVKKVLNTLLSAYRRYFPKTVFIGENYDSALMNARLRKTPIRWRL
jgi:hypothetical protein